MCKVEIARDNKHLILKKIVRCSTQYISTTAGPNTQVFFLSMSDHPLQKLQKEIAQLKELRSMPIIRVSEACTDLRDYVQGQATNDPMLPQYLGENVWLAPSRDGCCNLH